MTSSVPRRSPRRQYRRSHGAALELAPLAFGQATPDAEPFVVGKGILQALGTHLAGDADLLRLTGGATLLREERLRVGLRAQGTLLPGECAVVVKDLRQWKVRLRSEERRVGYWSTSQGR